VLVLLLQTWLRVALGYHTTAQVLVGAALGTATAAGWFELGVAKVLPALQQSAAATHALYAATGLAMAAFGIKNVMSWAEERQHLRENSMNRHRQQQEKEEEEMNGLHSHTQAQQWQQLRESKEEAQPAADAQMNGCTAPASTAWAG
jgi:hypothetical protein